MSHVQKEEVGSDSVPEKEVEDRGVDTAITASQSSAAALVTGLSNSAADNWPTDSQLSGMTLAQLRDVARERNLRVRSSASKTELALALCRARISSAGPVQGAAPPQEDEDALENQRDLSSALQTSSGRAKRGRTAMAASDDVKAVREEADLKVCVLPIEFHDFCFAACGAGISPLAIAICLAAS